MSRILFLGTMVPYDGKVTEHKTCVFRHLTDFSGTKDDDDASCRVTGLRMELGWDLRFGPGTGTGEGG